MVAIDPKPKGVDLKVADTKPTVAEVNAKKTGLVRFGITSLMSANLFSDKKTRRQNARTLAAWLKGRPKA